MEYTTFILLNQFYRCIISVVSSPSSSSALATAVAEVMTTTTPANAQILTVFERKCKYKLALVVLNEVLNWT